MAKKKKTILVTRIKCHQCSLTVKLHKLDKLIFNNNEQHLNDRRMNA